MVVQGQAIGITDALARRKRYAFEQQAWGDTGTQLFIYGAEGILDQVVRHPAGERREGDSLLKTRAEIEDAISSTRHWSAPDARATVDTRGQGRQGCGQEGDDQEGEGVQDSSLPHIHRSSPVV